MAYTHQSKVKNNGVIDDPSELFDTCWYMENTKQDDIMEIMHQFDQGCDDGTDEITCLMDYMRLLD